MNGESERTGAQIMCEALIRHGVEVIFGIPGGAIMPFYHALPEYAPQLRHVLCRHEQGAGHAAEGYARASGRVGVCVATSGPGATNLVTPIANAWMDSTPLVAVVGQVATPLLGSDAFQEVDFAGLTLPITKHACLVRSVADLPRAFAEAFHIATSGRPGPVVIEVAKDVQQARTMPRSSDGIAVSADAASSAAELDETAIDAVAGLIARASRPLLLVGAGVIQSGAHELLRDLAERMNLPVATTLQGLGAFPQDHPLSLGMVGMHGSVRVNRAIQRCDLLINIGSRFDDRVTGRASTFARNAQIVHVDIDPAEIGKIVPVDVGVVADASAALRALGARVSCVSRSARASWFAELDGLRQRAGRLAPPPADEEANVCTPDDLFAALRAHLLAHGDARVVTDVGQHQMWAAQQLEWRHPRTHLTSGGAGTMGFAVPAALGAALACPNETIWAIVGDGGFQMTSQELATVVQEEIANIKIIVVNNGYLGMVRQWQQLFEGRRYSATRLSGPSFVGLAEAYGVLGIRVDDGMEICAALEAARTHPGPVVIDCVVEREANVFPIVPQGRAIDQMLGEECDAAAAS